MRIQAMIEFKTHLYHQKLHRLVLVSKKALLCLVSGINLVNMSN